MVVKWEGTLRPVCCSFVFCVGVLGCRVQANMSRSAIGSKRIQFEGEEHLCRCIALASSLCQGSQVALIGVTRRDIYIYTEREVALRSASLNAYKEPRDYRHVATPCAFYSGCPTVCAWVEGIQDEMTKAACTGRKLKYRCSLDLLKEALVVTGTEPSIRDIGVCSPISRFLPHDQVFCIPMTPAASDAWDSVCTADCICINNFWASTKPLADGIVSGTAQSLGHLQSCDASCLWACC